MRRGVALAFVLLTSLSLVRIADAQRKPTKRKLTDLKSNLRSVRQKRQTVRAQIKSTKRALSSVLSDIKQVDGRLTALEDSVSETEDHLSESRVQAAKTAVELSAAQKRLDAQKKGMATRIRRIYMQGNPTVISALLGSHDVGEIASRQFLFHRIEQRDREAFTSFRDASEAVATKKREADQLVVRIRDLLNRQHEQQNDLQEARSRKKQYLGELNTRMGELKELAAQFEQDEATITNQIEAYMREMAAANRKSGGKLPKYSGGRFARPISAPMTSSFGMRYHPILHYRRMHAGVDFGAPVGTTIRAAANGIVIAAQRMSGYGNVVIVDHGGGYATVYGHCSRFLVSSGQRVSRGQPIAKVGSTGLSTGPHLHFEVRINGRAVNPVGYL